MNRNGIIKTLDLCIDCLNKSYEREVFLMEVPELVKVYIMQLITIKILNEVGINLRSDLELPNIFMIDHPKNDDWDDEDFDGYESEYYVESHPVIFCSNFGLSWKSEKINYEGNMHRRYMLDKLSDFQEKLYEAAGSIHQVIDTDSALTMFENFTQTMREQIKEDYLKFMSDEDFEDMVRFMDSVGCPLDGRERAKFKQYKDDTETTILGYQYYFSDIISSYMNNDGNNKSINYYITRLEEFYQKRNISYFSNLNGLYDNKFVLLATRATGYYGEETGILDTAPLFLCYARLLEQLIEQESGGISHERAAV